jgi:putative intracellular protease/amidase
VVPFLLEDAMKSAGADFHSALLPMLTHVEHDGNLLTGQNPHSSAALADKLVEALTGR